MKRPRFSLRDLFWLVLVCALACAWWVEQRRLSARIDELTLLVESQRELEQARKALELEKAARQAALANLKQRNRDYVAQILRDYEAQTLKSQEQSNYWGPLVIESPFHESMLKGESPQ